MKPAPAATRFACGALAAAIIAFAWLRFSDNTADNDLWGHVLYGQRNLAAGTIERTDPFSWTAPGARWINHEVLAECALGWAHRVGGGTGLWVLMIALAGTAVIWALRQGAGFEREQRWTALLLLAASVNFIALGCAARPQMFTLLGLVALLAILRRFLGGAVAWGSALPPLFALWANVHGGFLAGLLIVAVAALAECGSLFLPRLAGVLPFAPPSWRPGGTRITIIAVLSVLAVAFNPWGLGLLRWTIESVTLPRPSITEWQPTALTFANAPFYAVLTLSAAGWFLSRRPRRLWEAAVLLLLGGMAVMSQRHEPLFGLANLILTPRHLADAYDRLAGRVKSLRTWLARPPVQWGFGVALAITALGGARASLVAPREHPFTIEVPREEYPVAAIAFVREHALIGNTLTFFDWGQQILWELPDNPVSFDGRLDTVYPRAVMNAHWALYAGRDPGKAFPLDRAKVAILPTDSGGADLLRRQGWKLVYRDPLVAVLTAPGVQFPGLDPRAPTVFAGSSAVSGRVPFPDRPAPLADPHRVYIP